MSTRVDELLGSEWIISSCWHVAVYCWNFWHWLPTIFAFLLHFLLLERRRLPLPTAMKNVNNVNNVKHYIVTFYLRILRRSNTPRRRHFQSIYRELVVHECKWDHCLRPMWMSLDHREIQDSAVPNVFHQLSIRQSVFWPVHAMTLFRPKQLRIIEKHKLKLLQTEFFPRPNASSLTSTTLYSPSLAVCPSKICLMCKRSEAFSYSSDLTSHVTDASFLSSDTPSFSERSIEKNAKLN